MEIQTLNSTTMRDQPPEIDRRKIQNPNSTAVGESSPEIDRLSSLPDFLLEEILSHLPTSAAAATTVLSQRWSHLWTRVTRLHFDADDLSTTTATATLRTFLTNVDKALSRFDSFSNVVSFYFRFGLFDGEFADNRDALDFCSSYLMRWFNRICGSHTRRIDFADSFGEAGTSNCFVAISIQNSVVAKTMNSSAQLLNFVRNDDEFELSNCFYCLPPCVFQSETLTELILTNSFWFKLPECINLPNLKKFSLRLSDTNHDLMRTLFKSLPLLEELTLLSSFCRNDHVIEIPAPCLKIFTVEFLGDNSRVEILINAPKLEHISLSCCNSLVLRFVKIPLALSSAKLVFAPDKFDGDDPDNRILELLKGISRVRSLNLSGTTLNALNCVAEDELPSFEKLVDFGLYSFVIKYTSFDVPLWVLRRVKNIKIKIRGEHDDEALGLLEYLLDNTNVLERSVFPFTALLIIGICCRLRMISSNNWSCCRRLLHAVKLSLMAYLYLQLQAWKKERSFVDSLVHAIVNAILDGTNTATVDRSMLESSIILANLEHLSECCYGYGRILVTITCRIHKSYESFLIAL